MVTNARDDLPYPLIHMITTNLFPVITTSIFYKLISRVPVNRIYCSSSNSSFCVNIYIMLNYGIITTFGDPFALFWFCPDGIVYDLVEGYLSFWTYYYRIFKSRS